MTETAPEPRDNPDLLGQERAERALLDASASGRLPHAWIFAGPSGVGKATLAYRFARFLFAGGAAAEQGPSLFGDAPAAPATLAVDRQSPVFRRVAASGHADLLTVERRFDDDKGKSKKDIAVDDVRKIAPFLRLTAAEGGWRVVIVDGAESLNRAGQNALLKILEEPPPRCCLLLVTDRPGALLPTVRSRARTLTLEALDEAVVRELLARWRADLDAGARDALARMADGSIGRALALAEADGLELYAELVQLLATLPRLDVVAAHQFADRLGAASADAAYRVTVELIGWWLTRAARFAARGTVPPEILPGDSAPAARFRDPRSLERLVHAWDKAARQFQTTDAANLDRRHALLAALRAIEAAAA
jgi:DNA polymerase III subunit delta'